jgi:hypothetical protein
MRGGGGYSSSSPGGCYESGAVQADRIGDCCCTVEESDSAAIGDSRDNISATPGCSFDNQASTSAEYRPITTKTTSNCSAADGTKRSWSQNRRAVRAFSAAVPQQQKQLPQQQQTLAWIRHHNPGHRSLLAETASRQACSASPLPHSSSAMNGRASGVGPSSCQMMAAQPASLRLTAVESVSYLSVPPLTRARLLHWTATCLHLDLYPA